jgi:hypothetical protein
VSSRRLYGAALLLAIAALTAPAGDSLFQRQAKELDRKKRVQEPALTLVPAYPYAAPYEEIRLK